MAPFRAMIITSDIIIIIIIIIIIDCHCSSLPVIGLLFIYVTGYYNICLYHLSVITMFFGLHMLLAWPGEVWHPTDADR